MATFEFTDPDGKTHVVEGPEGATEAQAFQILQTRLGTSTTSLADDVVPESDASLAAADATSALNEGLDPAEQRGIGLATRAVAFAPAKAATGIADLVGTVLNAGDRGLQNLFGFDNPSPIPTDSTDTLNALLDEFLPSPDTIPEKIASVGGEVAFTGGAAASGLAPKAASVAKNPNAQSIVRNLGDDIGEFFAKHPIKSGVIEGTGGLGAGTGQTLAQEADLSPAGQMLATVGGGIAGGVTPQAVINTSRKAATGISNVLDSALSGELRAAKALQGAAADPAVAAAKAADAPEGVSPARASEELGVQALERRVLQDDPVAGAKAAADLEGAEIRTIKQLADDFGPTTDKAAWQQEVIVRGAPDNANIKVGQPDEMLDDAAKSFGAAYDDVAGFPLRTENVQVAGGDVSLRDSFKSATSNRGIIADKKWRRGIADFLDGLLDDLARGRKTDDGVTDVQSETLLNMRSTIRSEQRRRAKSGVNNPRAAAEAEMLNAANKSVTDVIESQLPADAAAALRATDDRYRDFLTVQSAVLRSGDKGLTPEALKAAVKASSTAGSVARGNTGELGRLAETGRDAAATLGKPDQAARLTRNMTAEQLKTAKADFNEAVIAKATPSDGILKGKKYLEQLDANEATLTAAGFTTAELGQMRKVGQQLEMIQSRTPAAVNKLLEDDVGNIMRLFGAIAGSKSGARLLKLLGGSGGAGPSLIVAQFGSKVMQGTLTRLSVDKADEMIRAAMTDKELFGALMTRPTDTIKKQADAARTIQAWIARTAPEDE